MATIIPSSGSISAEYMLKYLGGTDSAGANLYLSYPVNGTTPTGPNLSLNQIFNSRYPNDINTWTGSMSYGSLRGKCFGMYTSSSRTVLHGRRYEDPRREGYFQAYFGFGTPTAGLSGVLNTVNQRFPIGIRISTLNGNAFGLMVRAYTSRGSWTILPYSTSTFEIIGEYSAIILDAAPGFSYELYLQVWPAKDGNTLETGAGVHSIGLILEESGEFSSEPIRDPP